MYLFLFEGVSTQAQQWDQQAVELHWSIFHVPTTDTKLVKSKGLRGFSCSSVVKSLPANVETRSIFWSERSPGKGNDHLLQYTCLEKPMDRGAWWATVCGVAGVGHNLETKQVGLKVQEGHCLVPTLCKNSSFSPLFTSL